MPEVKAFLASPALQRVGKFSAKKSTAQPTDTEPPSLGACTLSGER